MLKNKTLNVYTVSLYTSENFVKCNGAIRRERLLARSSADAMSMFIFKFEALVSKTENPLIIVKLHD